MTDNITPQTQAPPPKDERKPASGSGNSRGPKKNGPNTNPKSTGTSSQAGTRPSSRSSTRKPSSSTPVAESGSDTASKKGAENGKKPEQRGKSSGGGRTGHRKGPSTSQAIRNTNSRDTKTSGSPAPQSTESSAALSSLQNLIADLKTASPNQQAAGPPITFGPTTPNVSNLPVNAPVFQPGASSYAGMGGDQRHRKAASLGNSALSGNFNSFSPHLGSTIEEDGNGSFEEGEIPERFSGQASHQPRSQSQSFVPPRFAALAAQQQEQMDTVGPTGRPQLAPGFMFGAGPRKHAPLMGPPINEEDVGFQFPQQQSQGLPNDLPAHDVTQRKAESGEITGIMAEQVCSTTATQTFAYTSA